MGDDRRKRSDDIIDNGTAWKATDIFDLAIGRRSWSFGGPQDGTRQDRIDSVIIHRDRDVTPQKAAGISRDRHGLRAVD